MNIKLSKQSFRLLKRLGRIKASVFLEINQSDRYGLFQYDQKTLVTLLKPKKR